MLTGREVEEGGFHFPSARLYFLTFLQRTRTIDNTERSIIKIRKRFTFERPILQAVKQCQVRGIRYHLPLRSILHLSVLWHVPGLPSTLLFLTLEISPGEGRTAR